MPLDFSGQNLRGRSFKGQNLTGANFSYADIRGTDFSYAILKGANFTGAKAGLQKRWAIFLTLISWFLSGLLGLYWFISGYLVWLIFDTAKLRNQIGGWANLIILITLSWIAIRQGVRTGSISGVSVFISIISLALAIPFPYAETFTLYSGFVGIITFAFAFFLLFTFVYHIAGNTALIVATVVAATILMLNIYIVLRAIKGDEKYSLIYTTAIAIAATGGTSFRNSDLTYADFSSATLNNTDFRKAILTHTRFYEAKKLYFSRLADTILSNPDVVNLVVSCNGRNKSYVAANLKGVNLKNADLKKANLKNADISGANLDGVCLEWANLTLTQAVGTDFTNAYMTGACIEAWNIDNTTKLDNVDCRFVYLLENPKLGTDDRERRPSSGEFKSGEFTKLFEELLNTVDLIFQNGIDWKAFVTAFKKVQVENEGTELAIQSIENKGDGVVVVKVAVSVDANKEKIHSEFNQSYQLALQAVEEKYKTQLQAKDEQIVIYRQQSAEMKEIISLLANKPVNIYNTQENKNMTNSNDSSRKVEIGSVGGDFNASGQALNLGEMDISGTVTNAINQLPDSPEPDKPGIKELLKQLEETIKAETNLSEEDKNEALEQLKTLAEAGQNPKEKTLQKAAKTAIKILKGTISNLPSAAILVETCSKILPQISQFLGLN